MTGTQSGVSSESAGAPSCEGLGRPWLCGQRWGTRSQGLRKSSRDKASRATEGEALTVPIPGEQEEGGTEKEEPRLASGFSMNWSPVKAIWWNGQGRSGERVGRGLSQWGGQKSGLKLG